MHTRSGNTGRAFFCAFAGIKNSTIFRKKRTIWKIALKINGKLPILCRFLAFEVSAYGIEGRKTIPGREMRTELLSAAARDGNSAVLY